ncbi:MAG: hypothetical protein KKA07_05380 [Bacteroidetes bacterium]|nr:hypothetical protein [Bacteroidota bacterium]MBU1718485.1 hypothetical protein [Bacteroidota bacterium]
MKKFFFLSLIAVSLLSSAYADKIRVNNNTGVSADFTSLSVAIDSASAGDTIYLEPSAVSYGNITLTKQLYIFGNGFHLTSNPNTQANPSPSMVEGFTVNNGAAGTLLTGIQFNTYLSINTNNITIKRNKIVNQGLYLGNNASNILILQNYLNATYGGSPSLNVPTGCSNILVHNNIIIRGSGYDAIYNTGTSGLQVSHNVIVGDVAVIQSTFTNNIMKSGTLTGSSNFYNRNVCNATQFPDDGNNLVNVNMQTVFDTTLTSVEAQYTLAAGSPAIGYGVGGADCGIFGGPDPYNFSGIPSIPAIFYFSAPSSGSESTGLPVHIKIKSHK